MSHYINSVFTGLSRKDHLMLIVGIARCICHEKLALDIAAIILVFYNDIIFINIPRRTLIWKTQEMESTLDLVWQSEKDLFFGNKTKFKIQCDDHSLLFTKIMTHFCEIEGNIFVFDIYYETIKRRIYLTITLSNQDDRFSFYYHIYCNQNGKESKNICYSQSLKFNIMLLREFVDNKRCNELELKCYIKLINMNGKKNTLKRRINEYSLRYINLNKSDVYLVGDDNKWAIISILDRETNSLSLYLQLLSFPPTISKLEIKGMIEIKCDNSNCNGLIFERKHHFTTRNGYNFKWRRLDSTQYKEMGVITKRRLSKINKLGLYVTINILSVYDIQLRPIKQSNWSQYHII